MEWCGYEVTAEQYKLCDMLWGGELDLASEVEDIYEKSCGKSATYWTDYKHDGMTPTDTLEGRPEEYSTHGYTDEFEGWGQGIIVNAVVSKGKKDSQEVLNVFPGIE